MTAASAQLAMSMFTIRTAPKKEEQVACSRCSDGCSRISVNAWRARCKDTSAPRFRTAKPLQRCAPLVRADPAFFCCRDKREEFSRGCAKVCDSRFLQCL